MKYLAGAFVSCVMVACASPEADYGPASAATSIDRDIAGFTNDTSHIAIRGTEVTFETHFTGEEVITHVQPIALEQVGMIIDALEAYDIFERDTEGDCSMQTDSAEFRLDVVLDAGTHSVSFYCKTPLLDLVTSIDELSGFTAWLPSR